MAAACAMGHPLRAVSITTCTWREGRVGIGNEPSCGLSWWEGGGEFCVLQ